MRPPSVALTPRISIRHHQNRLIVSWDGPWSLQQRLWRSFQQEVASCHDTGFWSRAQRSWSLRDTPANRAKLLGFLAEHAVETEVVWDGVLS